MKTLFFSLMVALFNVQSVWSQPVLTNGTIARLNFDGNATTDLVYGVSSTKSGEMPETWNVGFGIQPNGQFRFLRATPQRVPLAQGEVIDGAKPVYRTLVGANPPVEVYSLGLLSYRALSFDGGATWEYLTITPALEHESELLLGLKLALPTGTHYGWLKLARPVVDLHTPFEIQGHAYHPVPGEAIGAGEPPPPPPLQSAVVAEDGSLNFSWDTAWGEVLLEWTDNLGTPNWQPVPDGTVPPITQLPGDGQRFYRLRRP